MKKFYKTVINHPKTIFAIFLFAFILSLFARRLVSVNYDINDYLPKDTHSTKSIEVMEKEYGGGIPNARVMVRNVTVPEALRYKEKLLAIKGVSQVMWLDDAVDITVPLSMQDQDTVETYYKDQSALFTITADESNSKDMASAIRKIIGDDNAMTGKLVSIAATTESTEREVLLIAVFAVLFVLVVLTLTTKSFMEPVLVLAGLGIAIVINAGTNLVFNEISFVTNAAGSILQLAVSLDYSVFLIHRFEESRMVFKDRKEAMADALSKSTSSILSSGLTTVIGFLALVLMQFGLGADLGLALAKGVGISLITVFFFMPVLILKTYPLMEKTRHRAFLPGFHGFGKFVRKVTIPAACLFAIMVVPCYLASNANSYYYGSSHIFGDNTEYGGDTAAIEEEFGKSDTLVLMVPKGEMAKEKALSHDLNEISHVTSIISYAGTVGAEIPTEYPDEETLSLLISDKYSRMIITSDTGAEGDDAFLLTEEVRRTAEKYYPGTYYLAGQAVSTYDLMNTVKADMQKVNFIAIVAVFLVLLATLKSLVLPVILVFSIETAIWLNLAVPYFADQPVFYIAYLIISSVQLGSTVDYAILMTDRYRENREKLEKKDALIRTVSDVTVSILTSGSALTVVGLLLGWISSNRLLSQLGIFIGRGALFSLGIVLLVLPGLLYIIDSLSGRKAMSAGRKTTPAISRQKMYMGRKAMFLGRKAMLVWRKITVLLIPGLLILSSLIPAIEGRAACKMAAEYETSPAKAALIKCMAAGRIQDTENMGTAGTNEAAAASPKEEIVYINLNPDGSVRGIHVVNSFDMEGAAKILDYGDYTSVRNMTTMDEVRYSDGEVLIDANGGKIYYEGTPSSMEMPWDIQIRYYMDGKEYPAEKIAGMSGELKIKVSIKENDKCGGHFFDGFALQASLSLDTNKCKHIKANGATIANVGSSKQLTFTILPGMGMDTEITADVKDFAMGGIAVNGIPLNLNIKIDDSRLTEKIEELGSGITRLDDGAGALKDGTDTLKKKSDAFRDGADELKSGAGTLSESMKSLQAGSLSIQDALNELGSQSPALRQGSTGIKSALGLINSALGLVSPYQDELNKMTESSSKIRKSVDDMAAGIDAFRQTVGFAAYQAYMRPGGLSVSELMQKNTDEIRKMRQELDSVKAQIKETEDAGGDITALNEKASYLQEMTDLLSANNANIQGMENYLGTLRQNADALLDAATSLKNGYAAFDDELAEFTGTLSGLSYQMILLKTVINTLVTEYKKLDDGIAAYTDGVAKIIAGYAEMANGLVLAAKGSNALKEGTDTLSAGTTELLSGVSGLADGAGSLKDGTDELKNRTSKMGDLVAREIDSMLSSITGKDFVMTSFVSGKNTNVKSVQFVIQSDAIKAPVPEAPVKAEDKPLTFWQKLLDLFGVNAHE